MCIKVCINKCEHSNLYISVLVQCYIEHGEGKKKVTFLFPLIASIFLFHTIVDRGKRALAQICV